ncbi:unnamed protein product, partial [Prorocentrum cordatum]
WQGRANLRIGCRYPRAGIAEPRWPSRASRPLDARFVHLFDSQAAASIAAKGRREAATDSFGQAEHEAFFQRARRARLAKCRTRLRVLGVTGTTPKRYADALELLLELRVGIGVGPAAPPDIDEGVAECVEALWARAEGGRISVANYAVAAVGFFYPSVPQSLGLAWGLVETWRLCEPPVSASPFAQNWCWPSLGSPMNVVPATSRACWCSGLLASSARLSCSPSPSGRLHHRRQGRDQAP